MPRHGWIYDIFLSSPGDVNVERDIVEEVVNELNHPFINKNSVALNLMRWETEALSGRGADAQDVVDRTMFLRYDLYIGVLWSRFGTPTERAGSGTEEEFDRALARYDEGDTSINLTFFYRTDRPPVGVDPAQLAQVRAFRQRLQGANILVIYYRTTREFKEHLRRHLSNYAGETLRASRGGISVESTGDILSKFRALVTTLGRVQRDVAGSLPQLANGSGSVPGGPTLGAVYNNIWRRLDIAEQEVKAITVAITYDMRNLAADWVLVRNHRQLVLSFAELFHQEAKVIQQLMSELYFPRKGLKSLPVNMGAVLERHASLVDSCFNFVKQCEQQIHDIVGSSHK